MASVVTIPSDWQKAELAVDGPSLTVVLGDDDLRHKLAVLAAHCSGVVVSRSSPSQKARACCAWLPCLSLAQASRRAFCACPAC